MGVTIDSNLSFSEHVTYLCATTNRKLYALSRVSKYTSLQVSSTYEVIYYFPIQLLPFDLDDTE